MLTPIHNPCQRRSHGLSLSKLSPAAAEAVRTFASIVEKGAATAKAFATFVKERTERKGPEVFADFEIGQAGRRTVPGGDLQVH